jgi:Flp pilus assembly pilin Flp
MTMTLAIIRRFWRNEVGQDLLEYGLLAALIAIVAFAAVNALGTTIMNVFWSAIAAASV